MTITTAVVETKTGLHPTDRVRLVDMDTSRLEFRSTAGSSDVLGTLFGYVSVFNRFTEIDSWEGHFLEQVAPGAFQRTIKEHGHMFKVLFNHGIDPTIGEKPLGPHTVLEERSKGLYLEAELANTSYGVDIAALLRSGALNGMSIRFRVNEEGQTWEDPASKTSRNPKRIPERTIIEVERLYEAGPVTFPAFTMTSAGVRGWREGEALKSRLRKRLVGRVDKTIAELERPLNAERQKRLRLVAHVTAVQADIALKEVETVRRRYGW